MNKIEGGGGSSLLDMFRGRGKKGGLLKGIRKGGASLLGKGKGLFKSIGGKVSGKVGGKLLGGAGIAAAGSVGKTVAGKTGISMAAKIGGKGLGKSLLKKIPGIGLIAGLGFAASKLLNGDALGAIGEVASGLTSMIPGIGTAASVAIDAGMAARDIVKDSAGQAIQIQDKILSPATTPASTTAPSLAAKPGDKEKALTAIAPASPFRLEAKSVLQKNEAAPLRKEPPGKTAAGMSSALAGARGKGFDGPMPAFNSGTKELIDFLKTELLPLLRGDKHKRGAMGQLFMTGGSRGPAPALAAAPTGAFENKALDMMARDAVR